MTNNKKHTIIITCWKCSLRWLCNVI